MSDLNVLVLVPSLYDTAPGQRFRIEQWARYLEREGFRFTFVSFEDQELHDIIYQRGRYAKKAMYVVRAIVSRIKQLADIESYDIVFLHREIAMVGPAFLESFVSKRRVPLVYDFDDPIWLPYRSPTNSFLSRLKWQSKTATICKLASAIMVGNSRLENYARRYNKNVFVVPSTIDTEQYALKPARQKKSVTLGWTGSHSTLPFLKLIHDPLKRVAERYAVELLVISHTNTYDRDGLALDVTAKQWKSSTEASDLHEMDIGLGPFPDTGWTPWRCHGKILQYMGVGLPMVASPVGIIPDYVREGLNGFLARSETEWVEKLSRLIEDSNLRQRMGAHGRKLIEEKYSAQAWAPKVGEILTSL